MSLLNGVTCLEGALKFSFDSFAKFSEGMLLMKRFNRDCKMPCSLALTPFMCVCVCIDMFWTASLASTAVTASEEVCNAVEAARTATRTKNTADVAVRNAIEAERWGCHSGGGEGFA